MKSRHGLDLKKAIAIGWGKTKQTGNKFDALLVCAKTSAFPAGPNNDSSDVIKDIKGSWGPTCSMLQCLILVASCLETFHPQIMHSPSS